MFFRGAALAMLFCAFVTDECMGQGLSHGGYLETEVTAYPQTAPGDSGRWIGQSLLRYERQSVVPVCRQGHPVFQTLQHLPDEIAHRRLILGHEDVLSPLPGQTSSGRN